MQRAANGDRTFDAWLVLCAQSQDTWEQVSMTCSYTGKVRVTNMVSATCNGYASHHKLVQSLATALAQTTPEHVLLTMAFTHGRSSGYRW